MSNVEFEEDLYNKSNYSKAKTGGSFMIGLLIKTGLVKDEKQANYLLLLLAFIFIILTYIIIRNNFITPNTVDYIEAPDGTRYSIEEYEKLLEQGVDPLSTENIYE